MKQPVNVQVQTTSACNARCIMCPYADSWHKATPGVMDDALFERIVGQLEGLEIGKLCPYLQNDPFMDPRILERIAFLKRTLDFKCLEVSTNAMAMTPARAEGLVELLADTTHDLWISFHGVDAASHEAIMGLSFERCLENILHLLRLAQDTPLNIALVGGGEPMRRELVHEYNFSRDEYVAFWESVFEDHGIARRPRIVHFRYHDRAGTIRRNGIRLGSVVRPSLEGFRCPRIDGWLHFLYTGELVICCMDYHREQVFGDINTADLTDILDGPEYAALRAMVRGEAESPPDFICKRCISPGG